MSEDPDGSKIILPNEDRKKNNLVLSPVEKINSRALDGLRGFASIHVMVSKANKIAPLSSGCSAGGRDRILVTPCANRFK